MVFQPIIVSVMLLWQAGCQPSKPPAESTSREISNSLLAGGDARPSIMDIANDVRVDGNQEVIEVDLRDADDFGPLKETLEFPKLRSLLLTNSTAGDAEMEIIGQLQNLEHLDLRGCPLSDDGLKRLTTLPKLKVLKLSGKNGNTTVTDEGFRELGTLRTLKVIAADFLPITDDGLAAISPLDQIRELYLAKTEITGESVVTLQQLESLSKLRLAGTAFDDEGLQGLEALPQLVELDLSECDRLSDAAGGSLAKVSRLTKLNLYGTSLGDDAMQSLRTAEQLTWLNVDKTAITDKALPSIGQLEMLTFLHLGSTKITDAGLDSLVVLKNLETLIVTRTGVTQAGVQKLSPQLPTTEIQLNYDPDE